MASHPANIRTNVNVTMAVSAGMPSVIVHKSLSAYDDERSSNSGLSFYKGNRKSQKMKLVNYMSV